MIVSENVPLAPFTTLRVGGTARFFCTVETESDIDDTIVFAREHHLPLVVIGQGSNLLIPDEGVNALVLHPVLRGITFEEKDQRVLLIAGAGELWDTVVDVAAQEHLFGIENLAGIPGSVGGAAVQNIGAYGAELSETFVNAEVKDLRTGVTRQVSRDEARFGYRTSLFKKEPTLLITHVTLELSRTGSPHLAYADLARAQADGVALTTPREVVEAVRAIRARKFPDPAQEGSAGSFFKNPTLSQEAATALHDRYPELPMFEQPNGMQKVSLAWILDHLLHLKGYTHGSARVYEHQPLVIAVTRGACAGDIDTLATYIAGRVYDATGIVIEREVETVHPKRFQ